MALRSKKQNTTHSTKKAVAKPAAKKMPAKKQMSHPASKKHKSGKEKSDNTPAVTKQKGKKENISNTIPGSIPFLHVYSNGIIELEEGFFSKSYQLPEINFKTASDEDQINVAVKYSEFLNTFEPEVNVEVTLYNKTVDITEFQENVFLQMRADHLNQYRDEYNSMLMQKMSGAKNNIETVKVLTISFHAEDIKDADAKFNQIDGTVTEHLTHITKKGVPPMTIEERLDLLNAIYNQDSTVPLCREKTINGKVVKSFSLENCARQGITPKDVIAPTVLSFGDREMQIGPAYARSYHISNYPTWIKGTIMTDFINIPANMLVSVFFNTVAADEAIKLIKRQRTNISSSMIENQKRASRSGYDASLVSPELAEAKNETTELMGSLTHDNERLFLTEFVITLFGNSKEELDGYEEQLMLTANKNLITVKLLHRMQERGFNTSLPLGNFQMLTQRLMSSNTVSAILPFTVKEIRQEGGIYYGLNAASRNMILYDRTTDLNPNGCILGMPGAGKSFSAKREMLSVLLNTDDEVYIIDPEREYMPMVKALGGSTVKLASGSSTYINPFDMNIENSDDSGDPVKVKTEFIETICEIALAGRYGLSPIQKSIIDRCVIAIYDPYVKYLVQTEQTIDVENAPTMGDFYNMLLMQPQPEAQDLALSLERYVKGAVDIFSHHTNVDINNRFTVFDIKDITGGLKELALQICLDNIWNKMIDNRAKGKRTWFYIDEFYLMMQKPTSAQYIAQIWKRARKWNGVPTAITQNVEDMLKSEEARTIINNCSFIMLLGQAPINRIQLCNMLGISKEEEKYISAAKPGMGLIRIGEDIIPMDDAFPKDTQLYKLMTTKPDELKAS